MEGAQDRARVRSGADFHLLPQPRSGTSTHSGGVTLCPCSPPSPDPLHAPLVLLGPSPLDWAGGSFELPLEGRRGSHSARLPPQCSHQRFIKAEAKESVCLSSLNVLLPNKKFSGKCRKLKQADLKKKTGSGREQGRKERRGVSDASHSAPGTAQLGNHLQPRRLCTAQLWGSHSQRQQKWFCRGRRLAPSRCCGIRTAESLPQPTLISYRTLLSLTFLMSKHEASMTALPSLWCPM